jgi:DNA mismatch endonuclease (patch repair protein)
MGADERPATRRERPKPQSAERARLLGRVRQARTAPEEAVARLLRAAGLHYRRNLRGLPGSPDFVNFARGFAIFVNGCFWHAHRGCRRATVPKNNRAFWVEKFAANRRRDAAAIRALRRLGFRVLVVWECAVETAAARFARLAACPPRPVRRPPRPADRSKPLTPPRATAR